MSVSVFDMLEMYENDAAMRRTFGSRTVSVGRSRVRQSRVHPTLGFIDADYIEEGALTTGSDLDPSAKIIR